MARNDRTRRRGTQHAAADTPGTAEALRAARRIGVLSLVGAVAALVTVFVVVAVSSDRAGDVVHDGRPLPAVVQEVSGEEGDVVTVTYRDGGRRLTTDIQVWEGGEYRAGQHVVVHQDRNDPGHVVLDDYPRDSWWTGPALIVLGTVPVAVPFAVMVLVRSRRWRRAARRQPWSAATATLVHVRRGRSQAVAVRIEDHGGGLDGEYEASPTLVSKCYELTGGEPASRVPLQVIPLGGNRVLVSPPGGTPLVQLRVPRTGPGRRRMHRQLEQAVVLVDTVPAGPVAGETPDGTPDGS